MAQLYAEDASSFDPVRARRATEKLLDEPQFGAVWMIDVEGDLAGYIVILLAYSLEFGGRLGLLDELFVAESHRGRGVAVEALAFAEQQCREQGWQALHLEVDQDNYRAQSVYRRAGFQLHNRYSMTKWI